MNFSPRALCVFLVIAGTAFAQRSDEPVLEDYVPRVEDDLVIYIPKNAVRLGFRVLSGVKSDFSGQGLIASQATLGASTGIETRLYHDGYVGVDTRTVPDPSGTNVPITPDGRTNSWGFDHASQPTADGLITMHAYSANVTDTTLFEDDPGLTYGLELASEREFGSVFGSRMKWGVVAGVSINQILSEASGNVASTITTVTDYYSLGGQAAPEPPFAGPSFSIGVDTTPLLWSELLLREELNSSSNTAVLNKWRLRGAYMTLRAGPTLMLPITTRFSASISAGGVLVYAGTTYEVNQAFTPATGEDVIQHMISNDSALLPGFYVDANLQFDFTDNAGIYLGAVYQNSGEYEHELSSDDDLATYKSRVDLASLQGIRAGVSFKF